MFLMKKHYNGDLVSNRINNANNFDHLFRDFDNIFSELMPSITKTSYSDLYRTDTGYAFDIETPGFKKEDIKVELIEGYIKVSSEQKVSNHNKKTYKNISVNVKLPKGTSEDQITAKLENGILTIDLPGVTPPGNVSRNIKVE